MLKIIKWLNNEKECATECEIMWEGQEMGLHCIFNYFNFSIY